MCECKKWRVIKASPYAECYSLSSLFLTERFQSFPFLSIIKSEAKVLQYISNVSYNLAAPDAFLELIKLINTQECVMLSLPDTLQVLLHRFGSIT